MMPRKKLVALIFVSLFGVYGFVGERGGGWLRRVWELQGWGGVTYGILLKRSQRTRSAESWWAYQHFSEEEYQQRKEGV